MSTIAINASATTWGMPRRSARQALTALAQALVQDARDTVEAVSKSASEAVAEAATRPVPVKEPQVLDPQMPEYAVRIIGDEQGSRVISWLKPCNNMELSSRQKALSVDKIDPERYELTLLDRTTGAKRTFVIDGETQSQRIDVEAGHKYTASVVAVVRDSVGPIRSNAAHTDFAIYA